jgi:hypothetical protein
LNIGTPRNCLDGFDELDDLNDWNKCKNGVAPLYVLSIITIVPLVNRNYFFYLETGNRVQETENAAFLGRRFCNNWRFHWRIDATL